ncbi:MAG: amidophosphoribosyltransferase [Dictyoglomus thermophilum]|uniref:Amidophosphoribosyltransferase n=1 Tax=Dictyoglomus thermophilum TaxID=14 RepID=A0A7V4DWR8_DICTH|nr:amidophosphoribosyltransferase [Dictyoglomus thermophilum]MCX7719949.1 amidophosphoribosyltransferase [Dictyoglomus thermophilum]TYT22604.1 amidophosphoribosyltransferase [Dictyoglomus thermophilum]
MKLKEECGVVGVLTRDKVQASFIAYRGLLKLQHRGQESAGIVTFSGNEYYLYKDFGLVSQIFNGEKLKKLKGKIAVGHVRYSTSGKTEKENIQPFLVNLPRYGYVALAHNGHISNAVSLRRGLEKEGVIFQSTSDTEVILHLIAKSKMSDLKERVKEALSKVEGSYSLVIGSHEGVYGIRDPYGFRPLFLGKLEDGSYIFASETCALKEYPLSELVEVKPGEMIYIDKDGGVSREIFAESNISRFCLFEFIYFSRPDSIYDGKTVYHYRKEMGKVLAKEAPVDADWVVPVPDSGIPAAIGYGEESGIPLQMLLMRSHYVGRTFIQPKQKERESGVRMKFLFISDLIKGKRIVLVDDSLVRGTTGKILAEKLREEGAKEVHLRLSSPPLIHPCYYGVDIPNTKELISYYYSPEEISRILGFDSVAFLSIEGLLSILPERGYCGECFGKKIVKKEKGKVLLIV